MRKLVPPDASSGPVLTFRIDDARLATEDLLAPHQRLDEARVAAPDLAQHDHVGVGEDPGAVQLPGDLDKGAAKEITPDVDPSLPQPTFGHKRVQRLQMRRRGPMRRRRSHRRRAAVAARSSITRSESTAATLGQTVRNGTPLSDRPLPVSCPMPSSRDQPNAVRFQRAHLFRLKPTPKNISSGSPSGQSWAKHHRPRSRRQCHRLPTQRVSDFRWPPVQAPPSSEPKSISESLT